MKDRARVTVVAVVEEPETGLCQISSLEIKIDGRIVGGCAWGDGYKPHLARLGDEIGALMSERGAELVIRRARESQRLDDQEGVSDGQ